MSKRISHCAVSNCGSRNDGRIGFYRFPKGDMNRCIEWLSLCGGLELISKDVDYFYTHLRVCGKHFEGTMFLNMHRNRLLPHAKPVLSIPETSCEQTQAVFNVEQENLAGPSGLNIQVSISEEDTRKIPIIKSPAGTQTPPSLSARSPSKMKLRRTILNLRTIKFKLAKKNKRMAIKSSTSKNITEEDFNKLCEKFLPSNIVRLVQNQVNLHNKPPTSRRYTEEFKQFSLKLYFTSPKAYKLLEKSFILPSIRSLQRITQNVYFKVGFNDFVFAALKLKLSCLEANEKQCLICIDEMSIKSSLFYNLTRDQIIGFHNEGYGNKFLAAQSAFVIMAKGIYKKFKQPLCYFFTNTVCKGDRLKCIVIECIEKLELESGADVRGIISDQGSNFRELTKTLLITVEKPFFVLNNKKIYYFFDTPHLIKSVRNNLLKYNINFNNKVASWKDIEKFYESEQSKTLRMAPRLTNAHIHPTNFQKMRVKYATQVISESVAIGIATYVSFKALPVEASGTAEFLEKFDKLFDLFNSSKYKNAKQYNLAFMGADYQISYLTEMSNLFKSIKIFNNLGQNITNKIKCFDGWLMSINSLTLLWQDLKNENRNFLFTRRINQECLENFFGTIRSQGGHSTNPTPQNFQNAFKKLFSVNLFQHSESANCSADFEQILSQINQTVVTQLNFQQEKPTIQ